MRLFALMFLTLTCALGGCAIPRTVYMAQRIKNEIPVIPHGSMDVVSVEGSAIPEYKTPGGQIEIHSPLAPVPTYEWYRATLLAHGWALTHHHSFETNKDGHWEAPIPNDKGHFFDTYYAERKTRAGREALMFHLSTWNAPQGGCNLQIFYDGWFIWDTPTWVFNGMIVYPLIPYCRKPF